MKNVPLSSVKSDYLPAHVLPCLQVILCIRDKLAVFQLGIHGHLCLLPSNGCRWPGCRARGSIPNAMHRFSQARGSAGAVLSPSFQSGPPPHGHFQCLLCAAVHTFPCVLCHFADAAGLNTGRHVMWAGMFHLGQH